MDVINKKLTIQDVMSSVQITTNGKGGDQISVLGSPFVLLSTLTVYGNLSSLNRICLVVETMNDLEALSRHLNRRIVKGTDCSDSDLPFIQYKLDGGRDQISVSLHQFIN